MCQLMDHTRIASLLLLFLHAVTNLTGITNSMLTGKKPFRDVFAEFLQWIDATVYEVSLSTDVRHIPGKTQLLLALLFAVFNCSSSKQFLWPTMDSGLITQSH